MGTKPISEILLDNFIKCGFKNFYFSVNYKADMIRDYYGSGERWGVRIEYIEESAALGTAGSLSLLPLKLDKPFFVVNADILTNINFGHVLDFHQERQNNIHATLCMRQYHNTIPYGLIHFDETQQRLVNIEEKPTKSVFVSAGIYILEPQTLAFLPFNSHCDMPHFLTALVQRNFHVANVSYT